MSCKLLVTGASGFIGSHLVERLVHDGHEVRVFVEYNSQGDLGWLEHCASDVKGNFEVVLGDVRDAQTLLPACKGVNGIFHLAALIAIPYSYIAVKSYLDVNVKGTANVLEVAKRLGVDKVIHASTSETYGTAQYIPIDEGHPKVGQSPYAASKIAADAIAQAFAKSYDLDVGIVRPFNTFGPRQSARAFIPAVLTQLLGESNELCLGSLDVTRDFTFVSDTVDGFVKAFFSRFGAGDDANLGSGTEILLSDLVKKLQMMCDKDDIAVVVDDNRVRPAKSEVGRLLSDHRKAGSLFNWTPQFKGAEGFDEALQRTVEWFKEENNSRFYKPRTYAI